MKTALEQGDFVYTAEIVLGRDHEIPDAEKFVQDAVKAENGMQIISVTDLPGGNPALPPETFTEYIVSKGLTPIAHLTGKDGNRSFLESRLHTLAKLGVHNILALTGDAPSTGFGGKPKPVYDLDSVLLLQLISAMTSGISYNVGSREVQTTPFEFFPGAVVNPYKVTEPDQMMQLYKLELKIASGARYIIPQLGYNLRKLVELMQYMQLTQLDHIPVLANVYIPTATIAGFMQAGEVPGCVIADEFITKLKSEKKPQRLRRAALLIAAVRDLGFAGAHIGGFGLTHRDFVKIIEQSLELQDEWRDHLDDLIFPIPDEFYLFPEGSDGLSDPNGGALFGQEKYHLSEQLKLCRTVNNLLIKDGSFGARFFSNRLHDDDKEADSDDWRHGFWYNMLHLSRLFKQKALGCAGCGDCIQDHLNYSGCSMGRCHKETRNGPCGGSRMDGTCEVDPDQQCVWGVAYMNTLALAEDPRKYAETLIPPRDWELHKTNELANRYMDVDNKPRRIKISARKVPASEPVVEESTEA